jgi:hypothetical protein
MYYIKYVRNNKQQTEHTMSKYKSTKGEAIDHLLSFQASQSKSLKKHMKLGNKKIVATLEAQIKLINEDLAKLLCQ